MSQLKMESGLVTPAPGSNGWKSGGGVQISQLRTQKGLGVVQLAQSSQVSHMVPAFTIVQHKGQIVNRVQTLLSTTSSASSKLPWVEWLGGKYGEADKKQFNLFCRPMPTKPRHGFTESRMVYTIQDIQAVWDEMVQLEPQGELMLITPIHAALNFIITPGGLTIGPGHDGATAGHHSYSIPMVPKLSSYWESLCQLSKVDTTGQWPFIEAVLTPKGNLWLTQLRAGPQIKSMAPDYIPEAVTVTKVLETTGDLVEWETLMEQHWEPGTVIWHPGGNLWSHYSVHAILHKLPICISFEPKVGQTLTKLDDASFSLAYDLRAMRAGVVAGTTIPIGEGAERKTSRQRAVCVVLFAMHNATVLRGTHAFWLGAGAALMHRLGVAASLGEWRHSKKGKDCIFRGMQRDQVYEEAFPRPFLARKLLPNATESFAEESWTSGFGGAKWADCANSVIRLDRSLINLMGGGDQAQVIEVVDALNNAVNKAHNNGWWLNKFVQQTTFDQAAQGDFSPLFQAIPMMAALMGASLTEDLLDINARRWALAREIAESEGSLPTPQTATIVEVTIRPLFKTEQSWELMFEQGSWTVEQLAKVSKGVHCQYRFEGQEGSYETHDDYTPLTKVQLAILKTCFNDCGSIGSLSGSGARYLEGEACLQQKTNTKAVWTFSVHDVEITTTVIGGAE